MAIAQLIAQLSEQAQADIRRHSHLGEGLCFSFDARADTESTWPQQPTVYKTTSRTVVSLRLGCFRAREIVRRVERGPPQRSRALAALVGKAMRYDYELIAHVGTRTFLDGQAVGPLQQELAQRCPAVEIPTSSMYDLRGKFLFLLGALHRQSAPLLRQRCDAAGRGDWLIDGTLEPGTPLFFGIQETRWGIMLDCWKLPTEKADDMAACLNQAALAFGPPPHVVHDLGSAMALACQQGLPGVEQRVCHFHFASDVGEDLYQQPQRQLSARLRALGLQLRMHDQRKGQAERLRQQIVCGRGQLLLAELLSGQRPAARWDTTLAREVLLALHGWIMNYPQDGRRQGFPFDPYLLYLHRRLLKARSALDRLVAQIPDTIVLPGTFANLQKQLSRYRDDPEVASAAGLYEKAYTIFERLRSVLRLSTSGSKPMRDSYQVDAAEQQRLYQDLIELRADASRLGGAEPSTDESQLYGILSTHLEKYWNELGAGKREAVPERTTNALERRWGAAKRACRRATGRGSLTREFTALPGEFMLVGNLAIPEYVEVVMGSLGNLAGKLAEAARTAGTYSHWRRQGRSLQMGRLPRRLLARENFLENLLGVCQASAIAPGPC